MVGTDKRGLVYEATACTGCLCCVLECAQERSGLSGPSQARARIDLDLFGGPHNWNACRQCDVAACAEACPNEAMDFRDDTACWEIDEARCTACLTCRDACPHDALFVSESGALPLKCDLCGGTPACVEACHFAALSYGRGDAE